VEEGREEGGGREEEKGGEKEINKFKGNISKES
jgi:hypothetical protein